jgi:hypothetical protein
MHHAPRRVCLLERESDPDPKKCEPAIRTQDHALRAEVARRGDYIQAVCVDDGYSGELPPLERPAIREMLALADRGDIDYVLATELARTNRGDVFNYYFIRHELQRAGVRLEFLVETYEDDGESEVGALIEAIEVARPSIERRTIRRRFGAQALGGLADLLRERVESATGEGGVEAVIEEAVRATLGPLTQADLDGLDSDARRRKVRQIVEWVEVNDEGAWAHLHLSRKAVPIGNKTSPDCGRRRGYS